MESIDLEQYSKKFAKKKRGNLRSDLISLIAKKINRPYIHILKLTEAWTEEMLKDAAFEAEKDPIKFWIYRKKTLT